MDRASIYQLLLPELRSFPTDAARRTALEAATSTRNWHGAIALPTVVVVGMIVLISVVFSLLPFWSNWPLWTIPVVAPICAGTVGALAYRARLRRSLRDMLAKLAPFCKCGYNLTGNVSGRCPECGKDVPSPAKERRRCTSAGRRSRRVGSR